MNALRGLQYEEIRIMQLSGEVTSGRLFSLM